MKDYLKIKDMIIGFLKTIGTLSPGLEEKLRELLQIEDVRRKHTFLLGGEVSDRVYFITSGLVRAYYFDEKRDKRTNWIMKEQDVIIGMDSFYSRQPGDEYIETLEPTTVGSISYDELQMLYSEFPEFNWIGRILNEKYNDLASRRAKELRSNDATKRYQLFMENYPALVNRVPTKYIASYIGVEEETLYKIKNGNYNYPKKQ